MLIYYRGGVKIMKKISLLLIIFLLVSTMSVYAENNINNSKFTDVPLDHWSYTVTHNLRDLGITTGVGNNKFGLGEPIKRGQFITFLVKLMGWENVYPENNSFKDNMNSSMYYYGPIETALKHGVITKDSESFRPEENITREDMAIMIVRTLGYDHLAQQLHSGPRPFNDVAESIGYIRIARDLGIIQGTGNNQFNPKGTANREHAAAMMMRMYEISNQSINEIHGFYAIQSYFQKDLIPNLDSISFGWSRLEYDTEFNTLILNKTRKNNNDFVEPVGASDLIQYTSDHMLSKQLMVFAENIKFANDHSLGFIEYILRDEDLQNKAIDLLISEVAYQSNDSIAYDGIVIDFELMKGESLAKAYNQFLAKLKEQLIIHNKQLYVTVHPVRKPGEPYFDGYDYRSIGEIADKVILMAHDYGARKLTEQEMLNQYTLTPLTPINEIYYALQAITDEYSGVSDKSKIWLQISFDSIQWKIKDNRIINETPFRPGYESIYKRMLQNGVTFNYSKTLESPYLTFFNGEDETDNVLWYEDSRSIAAKIELAQLFGINGVSLWRLGTIPDYHESVFLDVWQQILKSKK